eukprot:scaffold71327_cov49-Phaeocystis_antarctica.AAC.1
MKSAQPAMLLTTSKDKAANKRYPSSIPPSVSSHTGVYNPLPAPVVLRTTEISRDLPTRLPAPFPSLSRPNWLARRCERAP